MLKFLIIIDSCVYLLLPLIWGLIIIINTQIYWYYKAEPVTRPSYLPQWEGNVLVMFTFRWAFDGDELNKVVRYKKLVNRLSIFFAIHIVICFCLWYYLKHNNPLNLWAGY